MAEEVDGQPRRTSFIVRCWSAVGAQRQLRCRVTDAATGRSYALVDLSALPALLRALAGGQAPVPEARPSSEGGR